MPNGKPDRSDMPLFFSKKEQAFNNSIATEHTESVTKQKIRYYLIDKDRTIVDDVYGESKQKVAIRIIILPARVQYNNPEITQTGSFPIDRRQNIQVHLLHDRIYNDLQFYPRVGDFIEYNGLCFEITTVIDDNPSMGSTHVKYGINITAVLSRENQFLISDMADEIDVEPLMGQSILDIPTTTARGHSGASGGSGESGISGIGATGTSGVSGAQGLDGISGLSGRVGDQGASGVSGTGGSQGSQGIQGAQGISGTSGLGHSGLSGTSGASTSGLSGTIGTSGVSGFSGTSGVSGNAQSGTSGVSGNAQSGTSGVSGNATSGVSGISGQAAISGVSGTNGNSGISGRVGDSGVSGISGQGGGSGVSGQIGTSGISGVSGNSGLSGVSGGTGNSGVSGVSGTSGTSGRAASNTFTLNGTVWMPSGIDTTVNLISFELEEPATLQTFKSYIVGDVGSTVNARKNGASNHLASNYTLSAADTYLTTPAVQNASFNAGDKIEAMITSLSGIPTQIAFKFVFARS